VSTTLPAKVTLQVTGAHAAARRPTQRWHEMSAEDLDLWRVSGLVRIRYAADDLGVSVETLRRRIREGSMKGQRVDGCWFVSEAEIERSRARSGMRRTGRPRRRSIATTAALTA
jgi:hypothetical protein